MLNKSLLSILGPTATGKTSLALQLAKKLISENKFEGVSLISADSRQVYQGLETLTGTDVPSEFKRIEAQENNQNPYDFFQHQDLPIKLHGVSIIKPVEDWSVTHFRDLAIFEIQNCWRKNWLLVVVGGTGLYHLQLFNNDPQLYVKPNPHIRQQAANKTVPQLRRVLEDLDPEKLEAMNHSDRHNPRRLVRAIEVAQALQNPTPRIKNRPIFNQPENYFKFGLKINPNQLQPKITNRVEERLKAGAVEEVEQLLQLDLSPHSPAMTATGVSQIIDYLQGQINKTQLIESWTLTELQYAKRQVTWFKKRKEINWLPADKPKKALQTVYQQLK